MLKSVKSELICNEEIRLVYKDNKNNCFVVRQRNEVIFYETIFFSFIHRNASIFLSIAN